MGNFRGPPPSDLIGSVLACAASGFKPCSGRPSVSFWKGDYASPKPTTCVSTILSQFEYVMVRKRDVPCWPCSNTFSPVWISPSLASGACRSIQSMANGAILPARANSEFSGVYPCRKLTANPSEMLVLEQNLLKWSLFEGKAWGPAKTLENQ